MADSIASWPVVRQSIIIRENVHLLLSKKWGWDGKVYLSIVHS